MGAIQSDQNCRPPIQPSDNLVNWGLQNNGPFATPSRSTRNPIDMAASDTRSVWVYPDIFHSKKQVLHFQIHKNIEAKKCEDEADVVQQSIKVSNIEMHLSLKDTQCSIGSQDSSRCFQRQIFFFLKNK